MASLSKLDVAAPVANDNQPMPANERAEFIAMIQKEAALRRPAVISDDSIDAETLLGMDFPPLEYVIPGYVVEGLTVLAGKPKLGKSWWAYDASIAVATGGKAMGSIDCEQGDVLYLALEDNRRRVKDRLLTLCPARKLLGTPVILVTPVILGVTKKSLVILVILK